MDYKNIILDAQAKYNFKALNTFENSSDEVYLEVETKDFKNACIGFHNLLSEPVSMLFAADERKDRKAFKVFCAFMAPKYKKWFFITTELPEKNPYYFSLAKEVYSSYLFERQMHEMFGILPEGNPDLRRLNLHEEAWPDDYYPLRKDFKAGWETGRTDKEFKFIRAEGEGIFEVPVGPVHAGIIGPGHFRFSAAGEPIINLEIRLGFTHRGVEKHFEGKTIEEAARISECVSGDSAFSHSLAFCLAIEKISGINVSQKARYLRAIFLELERMYNHLTAIGGIAVDVGFSFPAALAAIMKEGLLSLNKKLTASRYLKGVNCAGGVRKDIGISQRNILEETLKSVSLDFCRLRDMLFSSVSFMDRVDATGILKKKTAKDLGVKGLAGRACGIQQDLRKDFPGVYGTAGFRAVFEEAGDVLARLKARLREFEESIRLIRALISALALEENKENGFSPKAGFGLGYVESFRGPVLYWVKINQEGLIERCKIVDASFQNWQGLAYCVLGDIIPDFPVCNKSFDLSYSANDL